MRRIGRYITMRADVAQALLLCGCLALAACGSTGGVNPPGAPTAIPDLQGKGVSRVPIPDAVVHSHTVIGGLGTYTLPRQGDVGPAPTAAASATDAVRIVAVVGYGNGRYEDVGLHGASPHELPLAIPCTMGLSVTLDGHWGACITSQGVATFRLRAPGATPGPLEEHIVASMDSGYAGADVSWDPTGRYLAVAQLSNASNEESAPLDILALSPQYERATLALQVSGLPSLTYVRWSPDGRWLDISVKASELGQGYLIRLKQLFPVLPIYKQPVVHASLTLATNSLQQTLYYTAWRPGASSRLTDIENGRLRLIDPATGLAQDIADLGWPIDNTYSNVCAETWTSDGRYFVFALCDTNFPAFVGLPPKVFVYDSLAQ